MPNYSTSALGVDRRRRLFASLQPVLPGDQLWDALWLWEREFSEHAPFAISDYARRLAEFLGAPGTSQSLLDQVTQGIQGDGGALPEDPIDQMLQRVGQAEPQPAAVAVAAPSQNGGAAKSPSDVVFNALLNSIVAGAGRSEAGCDDLLRRHVASVAAGTSPGTRVSLTEWGRGNAETAYGVDPSEMASIVNTIYVWCCEELGPMATDRIFGDATRAAEALPESGSFSPRQLL